MAKISKRKLLELSVASHLSGKLTNTFEVISNYIFAGSSVFTLVNNQTGIRYTYYIQQIENKDGSLSPHFVSILSGDSQSYTFVGTIFDKKVYKHSTKTSIHGDTPSVKGIKYILAKLSQNKALDEIMDVYHLGRCGKCGRELTEPESIATGIGPICGGSERINLTLGQKRKLKIMSLED